MTTTPWPRLHREQQVLRAIADGRSVGQIAHEWFLSESTVRSQVRGILTKLGVGSQIEALAMAMRTGWLQPQTTEQSPPPPDRAAGMALRRIPRQR